MNEEQLLQEARKEAEKVYPEQQYRGTYPYRQEGYIQDIPKGQKDVIDLLNNMITPILPNMIPMRDITQISEGDKLFYELGYKKNIMGGYGDNWIREGIFKEIEDIKRFLKDDKMISDIEYLNHHNFMLIKSK